MLGRCHPFIVHPFMCECSDPLNLSLFSLALGDPIPIQYKSKTSRAQLSSMQNHLLLDALTSNASAPTLPVPILPPMPETVTGHDAASSIPSDANVAGKSTANKKKQMLMNTFAYSTKDLLILNPNDANFRLVVEWHKAGIKIEREDVRAHQTAVVALEESARNKFNEGDYEDAASLQKEAVDLKASFTERLYKFNSAVNISQVAKMAMDKHLGQKDFANSEDCRDGIGRVG